MVDDIKSTVTGHEYECCSRSGELELYLNIHHRGRCPDCGSRINRVTKHLVQPDELEKGETAAIEWCYRAQEDDRRGPMECVHGWINVISLTGKFKDSIPENKDSPEGQITWVMQ